MYQSEALFFLLLPNFTLALGDTEKTEEVAIQIAS